MNKKLLCLISFVFWSVSLYAGDIKLNSKDPPGVGDGKKLNRELINVPVASIENGVINIETEFASWGVAVCVYDGNGTIVYSSVSNTESKAHSFAIGSLSTDDYNIEVQIGEDYYEGDFTIMMNWGWQGNYDNTSYLACTSSRWTMDESPVVRYYSPHWTVNGHTYSELNFLLYDLCDSE